MKAICITFTIAIGVGVNSNEMFTFVTVDHTSTNQDAVRVEAVRITEEATNVAVTV